MKHNLSPSICSQFQILIVVILSLYSCARLTSFEAHASYRSAVNVIRQYSIYTAGVYPPGADMADTYQGRIVVIYAGVHHQLTVAAKGFLPRLIKVDFPSDLEGFTDGKVINPALLKQFIMAIDTSASPEQIDAEAKELFLVLERAGMGPKVGLPETEEIELISSSYKYR